MLWTPASDQAYSDARTRIITEGADPAEEIAKVKEVVDAELARIGGGSERVERAGRHRGRRHHGGRYCRGRHGACGQHAGHHGLIRAR